MTRIRTTAFLLAALFGALALLAAFGLHAGIVRGADGVAEAVKARWSAPEIESFMLYAGPLSLLFLMLGLGMMFWPSKRTTKQ